MVEISASVLNVEEEESAKTFYNLEVAKIDYFHIDVMDGKFVENNTVDKMNKYSNILKHITLLPIDVHLMVEDVETYVKLYSTIEPSVITFHYEAVKDKEKIKNIINLIRENNCKVGIAIKPETNIEKIYEYLPYIHMCLIMTVEPGKGGQTFLSEMIEKIEKLKKYIDENNLEIDIEVDGGINLKTAPEVKKAGANILVAGTAILMANKFEDIIKELKK